MDLKLTPKGPGRRPMQLDAEFSKQLTEADLAALTMERGIKPDPVERLHARHHRLARVLAAGAKPGEAAIICNYSNTRVSILLADASFINLVEHYKNMEDDAMLTAVEMMNDLSVDAMELLRIRMETEPEKFSSNMLLEISKSYLDRTGHGPTSQQTNVNIHMGMAERVQAGRKRAKEIEGELVDENANTKDKQAARQIEDQRAA